MPGSSPTIARREPTRRLKSVDLPTLGRPTIASVRATGRSHERDWFRDSYFTRRDIRQDAFGCAGVNDYYRDIVPFAVSSPSQSATSSLTSTASSAARIPSLYQFFGPGGVLAKTHATYEFRRSQLQMAEAVEQALTA